MSKSVGDFINELALKAGIKEDNEHLKAFLSTDPDVFHKMNIPDELVSGIDNNLLSIEQAKNNHPDIKRHYAAMTLNGVDTEIDATMEELQVPTDVRLVVKNERSTPKRFSLLVRKIKELESLKKNNDDKGEKLSLQNEINELRSKLREEQDGKEKVKTEYEGKIQNFHLQTELNTLMGDYKTVFDDMPKVARNAAINSLINKTLQDKNAEFKLGENGQIVLLRKDGSNVFGDDNRPWNPQTLIDFTLSQNKILKVTDQKPLTPNSGNTSNIIPGGNNGNNGNDSSNKNVKDPTLKNLVNSSLADLEKAEKAPVM